MSDKKDNRPKHNNRHRPSQLIKDIEMPNIDETLETLDKGSPKLNWIYVLLAMIIVFLTVWVIMLMNPETSDNQGPASGDDAQSNLTEIEADIESLEARIEALEQ